MKQTKHFFVWSIILFVVLPFTSSAATITWDGGGDGVTWTDANNWDTDAVPLETDDIVFLDHVSINFTASSNLITIQDLDIFHGSNITFNFPFKITGQTIFKADPLGGIFDEIVLTFNEALDHEVENDGWNLEGDAGWVTINFNDYAIIKQSPFIPVFGQIITLNVGEDADLVINNSINFGFGDGPNLTFEGSGNISINGSLSVNSSGVFTNNCTGSVCAVTPLSCFGVCAGTGFVSNPCSFIVPTVPFISGLKQPDSVLIQAPLISLIEGNIDPDTLETNIFQFRDSLVLIDVIPLPSKYNTALQALADLGMTDRLDNGSSTTVISGYFPIDSLPQLQTLENCVQDVRPLYLPLTDAGVALSQGDYSQQTFYVRDAYGLTGAGYKIGVLSDSYAISDPDHNDIHTGDLPAAGVEVLADLEGAGHATDEGRAMLQIIHDVAPAADLAFKTGFISPGNFAQSIRDLAEAGCDIIVDDITYVTEPFYIDGQVAQAVKDVSADGVTYVTSAGNYGVASYAATFDTAIGATLPVGVPSTSRAHAFDGANDIHQRITLEAGNYTVMLQWEDGIYSLGEDSALFDLDIYLYDDDGSLRYTHNSYNIGKDPFEIMDFRVEGVGAVSTNMWLPWVKGLR